MEDQPPAGKASLADLLRLKHHYNSRVTYGRLGLNAQEVEEMLKADYSKWPERWKAYTKNRRDVVGRLSNPVWAFAAVVASGVLYLWDGWFRVGGIALFAIAMYFGIREVGHREGYFDGFEDGRDDAIKEFTGLTEEDIRKASERAIEMEVDARVIGAMDSKQKD
jgi:hypothetical protein